jgi:hypothetical protein
MVPDAMEATLEAAAAALAGACQMSRWTAAGHLACGTFVAVTIAAARYAPAEQE